MTIPVLENVMCDFYVYELIHPKTKDPFYVGKGTGDRIKAYKTDHLNNISRSCRTAIKELRLEMLEPKISIVREGISEQAALDLEEFLIQKYGRRGYEAGGLLTNTIKRGYRAPTAGNLKQYKTIHIDAAVKDRLDRVCKENHWPVSTTTERLLIKFLDGDLSGSLYDVIRSD